MNPNPLPPTPPRPRYLLDRFNKLYVAVAVFSAALVAAAVILRLLGLLTPFYIPTGAMGPAASAGDHVAMQGLSYLTRNPHRGDIVVFKTDGLSYLEPGILYIKRIVGEPGEHVRLTGNEAFINDQPVALSNNLGKIIYGIPANNPSSYYPNTDVIVPEGCYFLLGDNWTNSADSRTYGCVPRKNIKGCLFLCYWPPTRIGTIR